MPDRFKKKLLSLLFPNADIAYSQSGEDMLLCNHIFNNQKSGFYVDVGAHHPRRFSNTYLLYKKGWSGINIDPVPNMQQLFKERVRDINISVGISNKRGFMQYYTFSKSPLNTFEPEVARQQEQKYGNPKEIETEVFTLREILDNYANNKKIDFMNIDVEGHEIEVLSSNDWEKYSPRVIALEDQNLDINHPEKSESFLFLKSKGYDLKNKLNYTSFYHKS